MSLPNPPALLDELLGLLEIDDGVPPGEADTSASRMEPEAAAHSPPMLPTAAEQPRSRLATSAEPAEVVDLAAVREKRQQRQALVDAAVDVTAGFLDTIRNAQQAGTTDFDDAIKGLPVVHRLIEHAERTEAAKRELANLPSISVSIGRMPGHQTGISVHVTRPGARAAQLPQIVDVDD